MLIIKVISQDLYVASEVSEKYAPVLEKELGLIPHSLMFIGGDSTLIVNGIEQISWFTYVEVDIPSDLDEKRDIITDILHEAFSQYGVHFMIKFNVYNRKDVVTLLNEEYPIFNESIVEVSPLFNDHGHEEDETD